MVGLRCEYIRRGIGNLLSLASCCSRSGVCTPVLERMVLDAHQNTTPSSDTARALLPSLPSACFCWAGKKSINEQHCSVVISGMSLAALEPL